MASFTIHALEKPLDERLTAKAAHYGISKNQLIKELLSQAIGLPVAGRYADDYREFCGEWTISDREEFEGSQADNARADGGDW